MLGALERTIKSRVENREDVFTSTYSWGRNYKGMQNRIGILGVK
jgi:hypothetical protein